jgi:cobalt/nickel transport system permease protein
MHIPDGYLSPATCAILYGAAAPFWYTALRRCKRALNARLAPLLSVSAAFCFVVMMFNLPLPGGTTGHAVGVGIAAIVLGPWAAIIAISVALAIQAFLFGDGGITALGANCFNMAIVGSLVAYGSYRLLSAGSPLGSARRVTAAGVAGYLAINAAALCAAVEFGIQPLFFTDASGAPLYAPYPLEIAIPAMMIGHLTIAGAAEVIVSAGVVAYLQRADRSLLKLTAGLAPEMDDQGGSTAIGGSPAVCAAATSGPGAATDWRSARRLWIGVGILLILTPLGLLAGGTAWGEWSAKDFSDTAGRTEIAASSANQAPPVEAPRGMERLSSIWTAPISRYAPPFMHSVVFGYVMSAMVGAGLILLIFLIVGRMPFGVMANSDQITTSPRQPVRKLRRGFVERTIASLHQAVERSLFAEQADEKRGLLQALDPRVKLFGMLLLIAAAATARQILVILGLLAVAVVTAALSGIQFRVLVTRVWIGAFVFSGLIVLPAVFITPGRAIYRVPPVGPSITAQGLTSATYLIARVETCATLAILLVLCTPWPHLLKALRALGAPQLVVLVLGMSYRYVFVMLRTAQEMFESRHSRMIGMLDGAQRRRLAAASIGVLMAKSLHLSGEVYLAMQSRGFRGEPRTIDDFNMRARDWWAVASFLALAAAAFWLGR